MKFKELQNKSSDELVKGLVLIKQELFNLRLQKAQGKMEKSSRLRECRKDFARIRTKLTQLKSV